MKRQAIVWDKILANHKSDQEVLFRIQDRTQKSTTLKRKQLNQKLGKRHEKTFPQREHTVGKEADVQHQP